MAWYIVDGTSPFEYEFPQMYTIDDAPAVFWRIVDGDLPFRSTGYPQMPTSIDEAPLSFWRIVDGDTPFRSTFPEMYIYKPFGGVSNVIKGDDVVGNMFFESTKLKRAYLGEFKVFQQPIGM